MASSPSIKGSPSRAAHSTEQAMESQVTSSVAGVSLWGRLVLAFMLAYAILEMHLGKCWESAVVGYVQLNSWNPDPNSWWVRFILACKVAGLKDAVKQDVGIVLRYSSVLLILCNCHSIIAKLRLTFNYVTRC
jgi:hypothetical protein